jgi:hypothetical protein
MVKTNFKKQPLITFVSRPDVALKNIKAMILINSELKKIKKKYAK